MYFLSTLSIHACLVVIAFLAITTTTEHSESVAHSERLITEPFTDTLSSVTERGGMKGALFPDCAERRGDVFEGQQQAADACHELQLGQAAAVCWCQCLWRVRCSKPHVLSTAKPEHLSQCLQTVLLFHFGRFVCLYLWTGIRCSSWT